MTGTQISTCLASFGKQQDKYLTLDEVSSINLRNNSSIYPNGDYEYYFNSSKLLILEYKRIGNDRELHTIIDYDLVFGFTFVNKVHPKFPCMYGRSA